MPDGGTTIRWMAGGKCTLSRADNRIMMVG